ncbi:hypothetical protein MUK42_35053 [Musa troglodytarum]|uniref:Secreted protein n=1 Tax=Musa troglodytarum TaxID=320322 RepID=A0A9E7KR20_9LILI|nr:hypothetical protein MUK42_35053 [Musa troglodytarum]
MPCLPMQLCGLLLVEAYMISQPCVQKMRGMVIWRGLPWVYYYDVYTNCHGIPDQQSSNPTCW